MFDPLQVPGSYVRPAVGAYQPTRYLRDTGVPLSSENPPPQDRTSDLCLWSYGGPRGGGVLMSEVPL